MMLTLSEAAERRGVHRRTVRRWMREGRLPYTLTPGGHYRIDADELRAMRVTTTEFARMVGVCQRTALRWAQMGKVDAIRPTPGQPWLIAAGEVDRIGPRPRGAR